MFGVNPVLKGEILEKKSWKVPLNPPFEWKVPNNSWNPGAKA